MVKKSKKTMNSNGPKLIIVESPAKIKTISKFLGKDYKIMSTFGHVKDLPSKKIGVDLDEKTKKINLVYDVLKDKAQVINDICRQAKLSSEVFLASDPDREGEIISWHIGQEIEKVFADDAKIYRITFNEITKPAIIEAIGHKSEIDLNKVQAQQARRVLDRWVGYEVSPILWRKIKKGLSAGRVQSVALLLVCNREHAIQDFNPEEYWSVHALFKVDSKNTLIAELVKVDDKQIKLKNKQETDAVVIGLKKESFLISKITDSLRSKKPLPPFMTSTLQQDAYNKLGFSVDRTMSIAQRLYEGVQLGQDTEALITYMRTDSLRISETALTATREFIEKEYGEKYLPKLSNIYSKEGAQDAHEAIRPINVTRSPDVIGKFMEKDALKLYELIWKRFVACQMTPAEYALRQVEISGGRFLFRVTGSTLKFDGFLKVYQVEEEEGDKDVIKLPKDLKEKDSLTLQKVDPKQHFTQPPPRYTEASLVKELEKLGIGRPSTYATILSTIQKRGYVEKEKKKFFPTELGRAVSDMLSKNLPDIINVTFTANMEEQLDKIEQGDVKRDKVLSDFYDKFRADLIRFGGKDIGKKSIQANMKCPECKSELYIRFGKAGDFLGCSNYPECKFTSNFERDESGTIRLISGEAKQQETDLTCPQCGKKLVKKMGKFGPFIACPGYPECKYIHQEKLSTPCPSCGNSLVKRRWRGGNFWGCSGYPKCKFAIFGEVVEKPCPKCSNPFMVVTKDKEGTVTQSCSSKECDYKETTKVDA
jgi:DNA topoisomerase-1